MVNCGISAPNTETGAHPETVPPRQLRCAMRLPRSESSGDVCPVPPRATCFPIHAHRLALLRPFPPARLPECPPRDPREAATRAPAGILREFCDLPQTATGSQAAIVQTLRAPPVAYTARSGHPATIRPDLYSPVLWPPGNVSR